ASAAGRDRAAARRKAAQADQDRAAVRDKAVAHRTAVALHNRAARHTAAAVVRIGERDRGGEAGGRLQAPGASYGHNCDTSPFYHWCR
ncbi:MAG: hypothetical protein VW169_03115, partial [Rhodospirillaceae bacterium]